MAATAPRPPEGETANLTPTSPAPSQKSVELERQLAEREANEAKISPRWRQAVLADADEQDSPVRPEARSQLRNAAWAETVTRVKLERQLHEVLGNAPPALGNPPVTPGLTAEERLRAFEALSAKAARQWIAWRDKAPTDQVLAARLGRGPGAAVCQEFRATRAWVQEAAQHLHVFRQLEHQSAQRIAR